MREGRDDRGHRTGELIVVLDLARKVTRALPALCLSAVICLLAANALSRLAGAPVVWAGSAAQWALIALGFLALLRLAPPAFAHRWGAVRAVVWSAACAFALATLAQGGLSAALSVGGVEPVLGLPRPLRFWILMGLAAAGLALLFMSAASVRLRLLATLAGASLALVPFEHLSFGWLAAAVFAAALAARVPIALALVSAAVLARPGFEAPSVAVSMVRGASLSVLLAVPLFVLTAALLVASGAAGRIVAIARAIGGSRRSALGEANVIASTLFGGVSGSSLADAAMNAKLLVPPMVAAGYTKQRAVAITAASAVLPNLLPPSIALLLAAAATDLSVRALWLAGIGAGLTLAFALWLAVRLTRPSGEVMAATQPDRQGAAADLLALGAILVAVVGGLRAGVFTAVEAGLAALPIALALTLARGGFGAVRHAFMTAAAQTAHIILLVAAVAPLSFLIATSGVAIADALPPGGLALVASALALCLLAGTVLDAGAAILLLLPLLVPPLVAAGHDPIHMGVCLTAALLIGGLTPPVGILVIVAREAVAAEGGFVAVLPYVAALVAGILVLVSVPPLTIGILAL